VVPLPDHFRSPQQILHELGIQSPSEIRLEAIAQHCNATIVHEPLQGSDARLVGYRSRAIITVNSVSPTYRQRFSAAHELGHWMWDRGKMAFHCHDKEFDGAVELDNSERRANRYAVELLMPECMFAPMLESHPLALDTVAHFSEIFRTSLAATGLRIIELTDRPAVLIYSENGKRRWYARSSRVSRDLKLSPTLPDKPEDWCLIVPSDLQDSHLIARCETRYLENGTTLSLIVWDSTQSPRTH